MQEALKELQQAKLTNDEIENLISTRFHDGFLCDYFDSIIKFWANITWYPKARIMVGRQVYNLLTKNIKFLIENKLPEPYEIMYILWLIDNEYLSYSNACKMLKSEEFVYQNNSEEYIKALFDKVKTGTNVDDKNFLIGQCLKLDPTINPRILNSFA